MHACGNNVTYYDQEYINLGITIATTQRMIVELSVKFQAVDTYSSSSMEVWLLLVQLVMHT